MQWQKHDQFILKKSFFAGERIWNKIDVFNRFNSMSSLTSKRASEPMADCHRSSENRLLKHFLSPIRFLFWRNDEFIVQFYFSPMAKNQRSKVQFLYVSVNTIFGIGNQMKFNEKHVTRMSNRSHEIVNSFSLISFAIFASNFGWKWENCRFLPKIHHFRVRISVRASTVRYKTLFDSIIEFRCKTFWKATISFQKCAMKAHRLQ